MSRHSSEYATPSEVAHAINSLTAADYKKLMWVATHWWIRRCLQTRWADPADLLHDAVAATLAGRKHWRKASVPIAKHLSRAMDNISGHLVAKGIKHTAACDAIGREHQDATSGGMIQNGVAAREELGIIHDIFSGDTQALELVRLKALGKTASEIRAQMGIDNTQFDTVTKRIRRKLAKAFEQLEVRR